MKTPGSFSKNMKVIHRTMFYFTYSRTYNDSCALKKALIIPLQIHILFGLSIGLHLKFTLGDQGKASINC